MPGFISEIASAGSVMAKVYGVIGQIINQEECYKERDVIIISAARRLYLTIFPQCSLPSELLYEGEEPGTVVNQGTSNVKPKPPYSLPAVYSIQSIPWGSNEINQNCRLAISDIQNYLNELNEKAKERINRYTSIVSYGHKNDSIRFILYLIMNAFVKLSALNLSDRNTLCEARNYINFLSGLKSDEESVIAFRQINAVSEDNSPLTVIGRACKALSEIQTIIEYRIATCSISEQINSLYTNLEGFIDDIFIFSGYILSEIPIKENEITIKHRELQNTPALVCLRTVLGNILATLQSNITNEGGRQLQIEFNHTRCFEYDTNQQMWMGLPDKSLLTEGSGVYKKFQEQGGVLIQEYLKICARLKELSNLRRSIHCFQDIFKFGGDIIVVVRFKEHLRLTLDTLKKMTDEIECSQKKLVAFAETAYDACFERTYKVAQDTEYWRKNYGYLKQPGFQQKRKDRVLNLRNAITEVESKLDLWEANPRAQIQKYRENERVYLDLINKTLSSLAISNAQYIPLREKLHSTELTPITLLVSDHPGSPERVLNDTNRRICSQKIQPLFPTLKEIETILTTYAEGKYRFNLDHIDYKIQRNNAEDGDTQPELIGVQGPHNIMLALWIQSAFIILGSSDSEKQILQTLNQSLQELQSSVAYKEKFSSIPFVETIRIKIESRLNILTRQDINEIDSSQELYMRRRTNAIEKNPLIVASNEERAQEMGERSLLSTDPTLFSERLRRLVEYGQASSNHKDFIAFWKRLCYLNGKLPEYQKCLHDLRVIEHTLTYLGQVKNGLTDPSLQDWARRAERVLQDTKAPENEELEKLKTIAEAKVRAFEKDILKMTTYELCMWSEEKPLSKGIIYVKTIGSCSLLYRLLTFQGKVETTTIEPQEMSESLKSAVQAFAHKASLGPLIGLLPEILDITASKGHTQFHGSIWIDGCYGELLETLKSSKVSMQDPIEFLKEVSHRLLQKKTCLVKDTDLSLMLSALNVDELTELKTMLGAEFDKIQNATVSDYQTIYFTATEVRSIKQALVTHVDGKKIARKFVKGLEAFLEEAFDLYGEAQSADAKLFWMEIIRGLLALGVSPIDWMKTQLETSREINAQNDRKFYIMAEKITLILYHLEFRAIYAGETYAYLSTCLNELMRQVKTFAENLYGCVVMDDTGRLVRAALKILPTRAEHERAAVLLATVHWIYLFLNELYLVDERGAVFSDPTGKGLQVHGWLMMVTGTGLL